MTLMLYPEAIEIVERFERFGDLLTPAKVSSKTRFSYSAFQHQDYNHDFTLYSVHLVVGLQYYIAILRFVCSRQ